MSLLNKQANVFTPDTRKQILFVSGIGIFRVRNKATIANTALWHYNIADSSPTLAKYLPYDSFKITNNSSEDIDFYINQNTDKKVLVPAGTIQTVTDVALWSWIVENLNTTDTISIGEIEVAFERQGATTNTLAKKIANVIGGA